MKTNKTNVPLKKIQRKQSPTIGLQ